MKLYSGKIATIAGEIIKQLTEAGDVEVSDAGEARLDVEAVLKEYIRTDREGYAGCACASIPHNRLKVPTRPRMVRILKGATLMIQRNVDSTTTG